MLFWREISKTCWLIFRKVEGYDNFRKNLSVRKSLLHLKLSLKGEYFILYIESYFQQNINSLVSTQWPEKSIACRHISIRAVSSK